MQLVVYTHVMDSHVLACALDEEQRLLDEYFDGDDDIAKYKRTVTDDYVMDLNVQLLL